MTDRIDNVDLDAIASEIEALERQRWSRSDPDGRAFAPLADAHRRRGELGWAREIVEEGLERLPEFASGHMVAARVYLDLEELEKASYALERVMALDPENVLALRTIAEMALEEGDWNRARGYFERAQLADPDEEGVSGPEEEGAESLWMTPEVPEDEGEPESAVSVESGTESETETETTAEILSSPTEEPAASGEIVDEWDVTESSSAELDTAEPSSEESSAEVPSSEVPSPEVPSPDAAASDAWSPSETGGQEVMTRTMAELYAQQGLVDRAIQVYEHLVAAEPGNLNLVDRLEGLKREREESGGSVPSIDAFAPEDVDAAAEEVAADEDAAEETGEAEIAAESTGAPSDPASDTAAVFFDRLLGWSGEEPSPVVSIDQLAPTPIDQLAPDS